MPFDYLTLKAFRQELRLTQAELAEKLQVPQSTVARWEGGYVAPNANHIGAMCDLGRVAGIEPGFFFPPYSHYPQRGVMPRTRLAGVIDAVLQIGQPPQRPGPS